MHRIPHGKSDNKSQEGIRPVVFVQHCLLCSSADFLVAYPTKALGTNVIYLNNVADVNIPRSINVNVIAIIPFQI